MVEPSNEVKQAAKTLVTQILNAIGTTHGDASTILGESFNRFAAAILGQAKRIAAEESRFK